MKWKRIERVISEMEGNKIFSHLPLRVIKNNNQQIKIKKANKSSVNKKIK